MNNLSIVVENVSKEYRLGAIGGATLYSELQTWWAKISGKEDPNTRIGAKTYSKNEKFLALNNVSFDVRQGEALGIIGRNGAGKSTLLKLISRVTAPTSGTIYLNGRITSMLEVGTGFHPELTGRENIFLNGAILGMKRAEILKKFNEIVEFSEVEQFIDTPVKRYSSGMYVKLAFSVAAHLDSEIMIMDEVLAVGDVQYQQKCLKKMREAATQTGKTILYVSHNMATVRQLCSRCIVLKDGQLKYGGNVEDSIAEYSSTYDGSELPTSYFFDGVKRLADKYASQIGISKVTFIGRNCAIYESNEEIVIEIEWFSNINAEKLRIAIGVSYQGSHVGVAESRPFISCEAGKRYVSRFSYNASNLLEGKYTFSVALFLAGENGFSYNYDQVTNMLVELTPIIRDSPNWKRQWWGDVRLNPVEFISND